jgi:hypothetical protein
LRQSPAGLPALTSCLSHHRAGRPFTHSNHCNPPPTARTHTHPHIHVHVTYAMHMYMCRRAWASIAASFTLSTAPTWRRALQPSSPRVRRRRGRRPRRRQSARGAGVRSCCVTRTLPLTLALALTLALTLTLTRCAAAAAARGDLRLHQAREREQQADGAQEAHRQAASACLQDRPSYTLHQSAHRPHPRPARTQLKH